MCVAIQTKSVIQLYRNLESAFKLNTMKLGVSKKVKRCCFCVQKKKAFSSFFRFVSSLFSFEYTLYARRRDPYRQTQWIAIYLPNYLVTLAQAVGLQCSLRRLFSNCMCVQLCQFTLLQPIVRKLYKKKHRWCINTILVILDSR